MVNIDKLKTALKERNISIEQASAAIEVNPVTFYRRINKCGEKFTVSEVEKLARLLNLNGESIQSIFFDDKLA